MVKTTKLIYSWLLKTIWNSLFITKLDQLLLSIIGCPDLEAGLQVAQRDCEQKTEGEFDNIRQSTLSQHNFLKFTLK